jgi:hypothetical protein
MAAFSLVDALILRPLPVHQPEQLIYLAFLTDSPERPEADTFNDPLFVRLRDASRAYVDLFAMSTQVSRRARFEGPGMSSRAHITNSAHSEAAAEETIR